MRRALVAGLAAVAVVVPASSASGITFGQPDAGRHPNVGSIVGRWVDEDGVRHLSQWCTGTLVDDRVVVTASHCFAGFQGSVTFYVTFDEVIDDDNGEHDGEVDPDVTLLTGTPVVNPLYGSGGANDPHDVGVFLLDRDSGIAPASLPPAGILDSRAVRSERFTTVGYGDVRATKTTAFQAIGEGWRREVATQSLNSVTKAWVTFSMNPATGNAGTCYGDSGGPHFLGAGPTETDVVVAVTVTGDRWCKATDTDYRLDTPAARAFLEDFVALP